MPSGRVHSSFVCFVLPESAHVADYLLLFRQSCAVHHGHQLFPSPRALSDRALLCACAVGSCSFVLSMFVLVLALEKHGVTAALGTS